jgi:hypothetical protein
MATIRLKRRTSGGSGPIVGKGTISSGEPLIDLNGGNLYIASTTKTDDITGDDYIEFANLDNVSTLVDDSIAALDLGNASTYDVGTAAGTIPVIGEDGLLPERVIPKEVRSGNKAEMTQASSDYFIIEETVTRLTTIGDITKEDITDLQNS